jgi:hypothetical protein
MTSPNDIPVQKFTVLGHEVYGCPVCGRQPYLWQDSGMYVFHHCQPRPRPVAYHDIQTAVTRWNELCLATIAGIVAF